MRSLSRLKASPGLLIRALVALGAVAAIAAAVANYAAGRSALGADVAEELVVLVMVGALARRLGIALPGNGFSSYILGVMAYALLDRGWPFGVLVGPGALGGGGVRMLGRPRARLARADARERRHGRLSRARRRPRRRHGGDVLGDPPGCAGRRAGPDPGAGSSDRARHQPREELSAHPGAGPPAGALGAHGVRTLRRRDQRDGAHRRHGRARRGHVPLRRPRR